MATAKSLRNPSEEIGRNNLECSICLEKYQQPKILDCKHSFCEQCLVTYRSSQHQDTWEIQCPVCRQQTQLPETGIQGLQTNLDIISLAEDLALQENQANLSNTEQLCELCDEGNEASHRCLDCAKNICANCRRTHLRIDDLSHHTTATIRDIREGKVTTKKRRPKCKNHKGEVTRFYCTTCEQLICRDCTVIDHCKPAHEYIDCIRAALTYKQSLNGLCSPLERALGNLLKSEENVSRMKRDLGNTVEEAVAEVRAKAEEIKKQVTAQEDCIVDEIRRFHKDRNKRLDEYRKRAGMMTKRMQYSLETAKDLISTASDSDFLSLYSTICKDLRFLASQNPTAVDERLVFLKFKRSQEAGDINFGELLREKWDLLREFGKEGSGPGEFYWARGIAELEQDEIAVADWEKRQVVICSMKGLQNDAIPMQARPLGVAATRTNNRLVVVCDDATDVKVFNKDRTLAFEFPTLPHRLGNKEVKLHGVAVKTDGTIVVCDWERRVLTEHSPTDGSLIRTIRIKTRPFYIDVDCNDRVVISDRGQKVDVIDGNGATLFTITPTIEGKRVQHCNGVCCDSTGIYIAMHNGEDTGHIHHYDTMGNYICCVAKGLHRPQGITFTADGQQLAVADTYSVKMFHMV